MTSVALCSASLEFYIQYSKLKGADTTHYLNQQDGRILKLSRELKNLQNALDRDFWRTDLPGCPGGFHDWFRAKSDLAWPSCRIVNFTLFPVFYEVPLKHPDRAKRDVEAMKPYFEDSVCEPCPWSASRATNHLATISVTCFGDWLPLTIQKKPMSMTRSSTARRPVAGERTTKPMRLTERPMPMACAHLKPA